MPSSARWLLENPLIWLCKERGGQEVRDSDEAWLMDAFEDEIVAETYEHGVVMKSASEVETILSNLSVSSRAALVKESLGEEVARLAPDRAGPLLAALGGLEVARLARVLTDPAELATEVASPRTLPVQEAPQEAPPNRPKVRPIQMGEFLWKFTCRRLLAIDKPELLAATADLWQFGAGVEGGAEAIIHFRKAVRALWRRGRLTAPLCTIDIDQENFFGSLDWSATRAEVTAVFPKRGASLAWKHAEPTLVHLDGHQSHKCDRGTAQGDVDAPMEASLVQGAVARAARRELYEEMRRASANSGADPELPRCPRGL